MISIWNRLFFAVILLGAAPLYAAPAAVAFYYGDKPPLADLQAFDIAVVEPEHVSDPRRHARSAADGIHELFAYLSVGEVQPSRAYYKDLPPQALRGENAAWGSRVVDQAAPGWQAFFLDRIVAPLWQQGWRGFFLDTLDSYQLFAKDDAQRRAQIQAMVGLLQEFKRRYPEARLILNRGFELLPDVAPLIHAVAAESLYQGFDAGRRVYRPVPSDDRAWLLAQLEKVRDQYRLPVIAIDYVDPRAKDARGKARDTAKQIQSHGFIPWVADGALASLGVGAREVVPRTVLVLVDGDIDLHYSEAQRFLGMPLNYLGLRYEFIDLNQESLPDIWMQGRYAGVVSWLRGGVNHPRLAEWMLRRIEEGVPVAVLDSFGFAMNARIAAALGLQTFNPGRVQRAAIQASDAALIGFEAEPIADRSQLQALRVLDPAARSLVSLTDERGNRYDAAAITAWGGYALDPFVMRELKAVQQDRWILHPLRFLQQALRLPELPVPDVTTDGGRRMLLAHIDGDGFASRAEFPGSPFAADVMLKEVLERYRIPTTVSVIEGEVGPQGLYPELSPQLEAIARRIFALPYVEAASHTYSHPFYWKNAVAMQAGQKSGEFPPAQALHLPIKGYRFDLERDIRGSMEYINSRLLPPGKRAAFLLWSGDCVPPPAALAETYRHGYLNMNGGDTLITESNKSWAAIAAQGIRKGGWYQVFAPNQNENVYTNNWTGPFYGFGRVVETFELTGKPYRFKPVNIYYHTYAASKPAALRGLQKAYDWALTQPLTHVYASQYARKVLDFENTVLARELATGILVVRTGADLRTLRLPPGAAAPSLDRSTGLAGVAPGPMGDYLILASAEARIAPIQPTQPAQRLAYVAEANGTVADVERITRATGEELRFSLTVNGAPQFAIAHGARCQVAAGGRALRPTMSGTWATAGQADVAQFAIDAPPGASMTSHAITVHCPR